MLTCWPSPNLNTCYILKSLNSATSNIEYCFGSSSCMKSASKSIIGTSNDRAFKLLGLILHSHLNIRWRGYNMNYGNIWIYTFLVIAQNSFNSTTDAKSVVALRNPDLVSTNIVIFGPVVLPWIDGEFIGLNPSKYQLGSRQTVPNCALGR